MKKSWKREYFSIPNLLGYFRILVIPVYLVLYFKAETEKDYLTAAAVMGLSALTDCFDGKIARKFHMVTDFGKILDPVSDKLTQGALAISLLFRYPLMEYVFILFLVKEIYMAVTGAVILWKGKKIDGARWCGKVCTTVLYTAMFLMILIPNMPLAAANILMLLCMGFMIYSLVSYMKFHYDMLKDDRLKGSAELKRNKSNKSDKINKSNKRKGWRIMAVLGGYFLFLLAGAALPYRKQPQISDEFAKEIHPEDYYGKEESGDRAMVIEDNGRALEERIRMIAGAKERIILSTFAFQADNSGKDMLAALYDAAERGVNIKILADGFNSCLYMEQNPYFYALSAHPNIEIKIYNTVNPLMPWKSMGRMHDKYVIADEDLYVIGGRNTFDYFLGDYEGHKNHDWDVLVYHTEGAGEDGSLRQLEKYFNAIWEKECCRLFHDKESLEDKISVKKAANELRVRYQRMEEEKPELFGGYDYAAVTVPARKITLISNPTGIYPKEPTAFYTLSQLMENAEKSVYVHTPYIICNDMMYQAFYRIGEKVPEFKLLTNSAVNNGNLFAAGDYTANKSKLLKTGMDIWEYEGGISYHGKCIAIDDDMSIIGSFNMDMRSVYLDTELMLAIDSTELNEQLRAKMEAYEKDALHVTGTDTYEERADRAKKEMPLFKGIKIKALHVLVNWARFLL